MTIVMIVRSVANYFLEKIEMPAEQKSGVVDVCVDMQVCDYGA